MTLSLKHTFTSAKTDGSDATLIQPSAWNSEHTITMATARVLGNVSGSTGVVSEVTADQILDQVAGTPASGDILVRGVSAYTRKAAGNLPYGPFVSIASAATTDLLTITTGCVSITGTTTITSFGTGVNLLRIVKFLGIPTLTYNATSLILPTAANITAAVGDVAEFLSDGAGNWTCLAYQRADGSALIPGARYDTVQSLTATQQTQARANILAGGVENAAQLGLCVNPFMEISQENGTTSGLCLNGPRYPVDQSYSILSTSSTGTVTTQQVADPFSATTGFKRFRNAIKITIGTAQASLAASDYIQSLFQAIEGNFWKGLGWGTTDAAPVDVVAVVSASVTGTYSLSIRNGAANRSYCTPISLIANTPTTIFVTIPGETTGLWATDNTIGAIFSICAGVGTTNSTTTNNSWQVNNAIGIVGGGTNLAATAGATFTIAYINAFPTGVLPYTTAAQVDLAHLANMRRPYDDELIRCQRYFFAVPTSGGAAYNSGGYSAASTANIITYFYPVVMRTTPSAALPTATVGNTSTPTFTVRNTSSYEVSTTTTATGGWQYYYSLGTINFNARM